MYSLYDTGIHMCLIFKGTEITLWYAKRQVKYNILKSNVIQAHSEVQQMYFIASIPLSSYTGRKNYILFHQKIQAPRVVINQRRSKNMNQSFLNLCHLKILSADFYANRLCSL